MLKPKFFISPAALMVALTLCCHVATAQPSTKNKPADKPDTILISRPAEPVNIGYTTTRRDNFTGSAATLVSDSHVKDLVSLSPDNLLQAQVPGVRVVATSSTSALSFIRGASTFNAGSEPLYIIDGIPVKASRFKNSLALNADNDPLADIHTEDIASITVLKDAQATAIYGVRGANGVVLITTNRGTSGKTYLDISLYAGIDERPGQAAVLDTAQYRAYVLEKEVASGVSQAGIVNGVGRYLLLSTPASQVERYNNSTNWQRLVTQNSVLNNFHLTLRGGDAVAKYALNVGYTGQSGAVTNTRFSRFNVRFNLDYKVGRKLSFLNSLVYSKVDRKTSDAGIPYNTNPLVLAALKPPTLAVNQQDATGGDLPYVDSADYAGRNNPYAVTNIMINKNNSNRISGKTIGQYIFSPKLSLKIGLFVDYFRLSETRFVPAAGFVPAGYINRYAARQNSYELMVLNENVLNYITAFGTGKHVLTAFAGNAIQSTTQDSKYGRAINASSDQQTTVNTSDPLSLDSIGSISPSWRLLSFFGSVNYTYNNKYLFGANIRTDGSSRFQTNKQWGYFPSVSVGWKLNEEAFLKNSKLVGLLKLRASYGITGNDNVGFTNAFNALVPAPYVYSAVKVGILGNPGFQWEQTKQFDAGVDAELLKGNLVVTADYYRKRTDKLYNIIQLPSISGFSTYAVSEGAVRNNGIEAAAAWKVLDNPSGISWQTRLTITYNKNKVLATPARLDSVVGYSDYATVLAPGVSLGAFYGYNALGVYASTGDVHVKNGASNGIPFKGGDILFEDVNSDGIIDEHDKKVIGNVNPTIFGGFTNNFRHKNIDLSVFVDFASGNKIYNAKRAALESMSNYDNQSTHVLRHWKNEGDITDMPRLLNGDPVGNTRFSSRWLEDGSYARIKAVTVGYTFPLKTVLKGIFTNARVLVTAQNLYTFSNYKGSSPDVANFANPVMYGIDYGNVPPQKAVIFGVQLGL
jgi:TonB-linked SusC/RagA family outer membrane protein